MGESDPPMPIVWEKSTHKLAAKQGGALARNPQPRSRGHPHSLRGPGCTLENWPRWLVLYSLPVFAAQQHNLSGVFLLIFFWPLLFTLSACHKEPAFMIPHADVSLSSCC